jgi:hypothetical protein
MLKWLFVSSCCSIAAACARSDGPTPPAVRTESVALGHAAAEPASAAPSRAPESLGGSTWVASADGRVRILGHGRSVVHDHGGPPAFVGSAGFEIDNQRAAAVQVSVRDIAWLVGSRCQPDAEVEAHPALGELRRANSTESAGASLLVPPRSRLVVEVGYAVQEAYMTSCERFATRVTFDVAGEALTAVAEHLVTRRTPLRRPK